MLTPTEIYDIGDRNRLFEMIQAIVLAIVQGATEFIPVSSSGHLVFVPWLFGWPAQDLLFDTILHWGTLFSLLLVYSRDLWNIAISFLRSLLRGDIFSAEARLGWFIILGTIPAAAAGFLLKPYLESLYTDVGAVGWQLILTAGLLASSEWLSRRMRADEGNALENIGLATALLIGAAQAVALIPGISRSGSTIAVALLAGLRRPDAARFSFLLGVPVFFGAGLLELSDVIAKTPDRLVGEAPMLLVGFVVSAITGYLAIRFLLNYLRRHSLYLFAVYCLCAGVAVILLANSWAG